MWTLNVLLSTTEQTKMIDLVDATTAELTKQCKGCLEPKALSEFHRARGGRVARCKGCIRLARSTPQAKEAKRARDNARYSANLESSRAKVRSRAAAARVGKRTFVDAYKERTRCRDCHNKFPAVCMDFDHLPGTHKVAGIGTMVSDARFSLDDIKAEIEKCDLVCACCHRLRTVKRVRSNPPRKSTRF